MLYSIVHAAVLPKAHAALGVLSTRAQGPDWLSAGLRKKKNHTQAVKLTFRVPVTLPACACVCPCPQKVAAVGFSPRSTWFGGKRNQVYLPKWHARAQFSGT